MKEQYAAITDIVENVDQVSLGIENMNEVVAKNSLVSAEIAKDIVKVATVAREKSDPSSNNEEDNFS